MKRLFLSLLVLFPFTANARPTRSLDDVLPAGNRICGALRHTKVGFVLQPENSPALGIRTSESLSGKMLTIVERYPFPLHICVPHPHPEQVDVSAPLWVEWFVYIDPAASGVSVVSQ